MSTEKATTNPCKAEVASTWQSLLPIRCLLSRYTSLIRWTVKHFCKIKDNKTACITNDNKNRTDVNLDIIKA